MLTDIAGVATAQPPGDDPVVVEYDVVPEWPKRPEHVSGKGWFPASQWMHRTRSGSSARDLTRSRYTQRRRIDRTWGRDQFVNPHQMRIDDEGNVWVADFGLHVVQKYSPEGKELLTIGIRG